MSVVYYLQGIEFEWDAAKNESNLIKHGVSFEEAAEVFLDPFYKLGDATRAHEERSFVLGYSFSQRILLVVYVDRKERNRIISVRPATRYERKFYERE